MGTGSSTAQQKTSEVCHGGDHIQVMEDTSAERLVPVNNTVKQNGDITLELNNKSFHHSEIPEHERKTFGKDGLEASPEEQMSQGDRKNMKAVNANPGEKISEVNAFNKNEDQTKTDKLSDEEIQIKRHSFLDKIEEKLLALQNISPRNLSEEGAPFSHSFRQCILILAKSYFNFKLGEVPYNVIYEHRDQVGKALIKHGAVKTICDVLSDALKRSDFVNKDGKPLNDLWLPIKNMALILLNYSDNQNDIKMAITDHSELLPLMLNFLTENHLGHFENSLSDELGKMCRFFLSIIHNCAALEENVPKLRELNVIPVTLKFLDSHAENIRLITISILADLVNEEEAELLRANVSIFKLLLKKLENALKEESHKDAGWSAHELTRAVRQLARNDANKEILVNEGCLPSLVKLLDDGNDSEVKEAINCIWTLSFNDENKKKMVQVSHLVEKVYNSYRNSTDASKQAFQGVLWSLRDELLKSEHFKSIGEEITNVKSDAKPK
ncbi:unnamed protein product, partial [Lymnaea stagnalis]